ncbi:MAG: dephospho-CoA kinase [Alphaproteobacteria bacterium]|jgi:dephospho-CoA kinase|nr:dephospho-CoA kinase [Alphaproteobacteria bacterium]
MIIGLTGGIASGKSTAARYLSENGAFVMDGDVLGHRAYEPNTAAFAQIAETFGSEVVGADGQIDRKALGGKVFGNPNALKQLTDILYPEIRRMFSEWIETTQADNPNALLVMDAAVLLEAGWEDLADETWVVIVDPDTAVDRAVARDGLDEAAVRKRIASQLSNDERSARADVVIDNSVNEAALIARLDAELARIR